MLERVLTVPHLLSSSVVDPSKMELSALARQLQVVFSEGTTDLEWRISQLKALKRVLESEEGSVRLLALCASVSLQICSQH